MVHGDIGDDSDDGIGGIGGVKASSESCFHDGDIGLLVGKVTEGNKCQGVKICRREISSLREEIEQLPGIAAERRFADTGAAEGYTFPH